MEALLADNACDVVRDGHLGAPAFEAAIKGSLDERAVQRSRQIEEHYLRENSPDTSDLRNQLAVAIGLVGADKLAAGITAGSGIKSLTPKVDRSGLDEGVPQ
jgi:hypothetical protein